MKSYLLLLATFSSCSRPSRRAYVVVKQSKQLLVNDRMKDIFRFLREYKRGNREERIERGEKELDFPSYDTSVRDLMNFHSGKLPKPHEAADRERKMG